MRTPDRVRHLFLIVRGDHLFLAVVEIADNLFLAVVEVADNLFVVFTGWCHLKARLREGVVQRAVRHTGDQVTRLKSLSVADLAVQRGPAGGGV